MSIDLLPPEDPPPAPPPLACNACFPIEAPEIIWFCIQGLRKGNLWVPGDPDTPNGNLAVLITAPCNWQCIQAGCQFIYQVTPATTKFSAKIIGSPNFFFAQLGIECGIWAANTLNNPVGKKFYGGWATAVPEMVGVPFALPDLMGLMSEEIYWARWLMPRPMENDQVVYGIYDRIGSTNVSIKIDHS